MKILVTGCAGMIGTQFSELLMKSGISVVGCDNFARGTKENLHYLEQLSESNKVSFEFHELDLINGLPQSLLKGVDTAVHLADVVGGIMYVFDNQLDVFNLSVTIDANVVRAVANSNVKKYIYAGTACSFPQELQNSTDSMLYEKDKFPAHPESAYGWGKLVGELQTTYLNESKMASTVGANVIFHNVYGPWCDFDLNTCQVIPALIRKASALSGNQSLEVWGGGDQARSFINSYDISKFLLKMVTSESSLRAFNGVQLGSEYGTTINDLAKLILKEAGKDINAISHINPNFRGDIGRIPDLSLAYKLGFNQEIDIHKGIKSLFQWAKTHDKI